VWHAKEKQKHVSFLSFRYKIRTKNPQRVIETAKKSGLIMRNMKKDHTNRAYVQVQSKDSFADLWPRFTPLKINGFSAFFSVESM